MNIFHVISCAILGGIILKVIGTKSVHVISFMESKSIMLERS